MDLPGHSEYSSSHLKMDHNAINTCARHYSEPSPLPPRLESLQKIQVDSVDSSIMARCNFGLSFCSVQSIIMQWHWKSTPEWVLLMLHTQSRRIHSMHTAPWMNQGAANENASSVRTVNCLWKPRIGSVLYLNRSSIGELQEPRPLHQQ